MIFVLNFLLYFIIFHAVSNLIDVTLIFSGIIVGPSDCVINCTVSAILAGVATLNDMF